MAIKLPSKMLLASLLFFSSGAVAVDNFKEFKRDTWDFQAATNYFGSDANYDSSGSRSALASGAKFTLWDVNLETRYTPRRDFSFFGGGLISTAISDNTVTKRTASTFTEVMGGVEFVAYSDFFQLIPEAGFIFPLEKVDRSADDAINSEGVLQVWGRVIAQKDFGTFRGYGWLGLNYRGDGRSYLMPWGAGAQLRIPRIRLGAELFGAQSISDDSDMGGSAELLRNVHLNQVNAGSFKFYSVNPSVIDTNLYATFLLTPKWSLQINGGMTVAGANAASGYHMGGFVRYTFDMTEGYVEQPFQPLDSPVPTERSQMYQREEAPLSSEKKVRQFREDTNDGVTQEAFKSRPTKKPGQIKSAPAQDFPVQLKKKKKRSY